MYHVISKTADEAGRRPILAAIPNRDAARTYAKDHDGTVKTDAEIEELRAAGKLAEPLVGDTAETFDSNAEAAAEQKIAEGQPAATDPVDPAWDGKTERRTQPDAAAVATVVQHAAEVSSNAAKVAAEAAALLGPVTGKGASILALAHQIKTTRPARKTIGKQEKAEPKRPATPDDVLAQAREHLLTIARPEAKMSKVQIVRDLATWGDKKLQRKDVFALIKSHPAGLEIADATISTQFQFARSGKERQHG